MQTAERVRQVLTEVGPLLELEAVTEGEDSTTWLLAIDEQTVVFVELDEANDRLMLSTPLGEPPEARRAELLETLLAYNSLWTQTGGVRMALDAPGGSVAQMFELAVGDLDASRFAAIFVQFVDISAGWRAVISGDGKSTDEEDTPGPHRDGGVRV